MVERIEGEGKDLRVPVTPSVGGVVMASGKRRTRKVADLNAQILMVLKESELSTKQLASELGVASTSIYSRCKRLEAKGQLKSKLVSGHGPMYCIDDDKVVDLSEYDKCKEEEHELRPTDKNERIWRLP